MDLNKTIDKIRSRIKPVLDLQSFFEVPGEMEKYSIYLDEQGDFKDKNIYSPKYGPRYVKTMKNGHELVYNVNAGTITNDDKLIITSGFNPINEYRSVETDERIICANNWEVLCHHEDGTVTNKDGIKLFLHERERITSRIASKVDFPIIFEREFNKGEITSRDFCKKWLAGKLNHLIDSVRNDKEFQQKQGRFLELSDEFLRWLNDDFTDLDKTKNKFNTIPIKEVIQFFEVLKTHRNKKGKGNFWMTEQDFNIFIKRSFNEETDLVKPKINIGSGDKLAISKLFWLYYDYCQKNDYCQNNNKKPFLDLLKNAFDTTKYDSLLIDNFKYDKSNYIWNIEV